MRSFCRIKIKDKDILKLFDVITVWMSKSLQNIKKQIW